MKESTKSENNKRPYGSPISDDEVKAFLEDLGLRNFSASTVDVRERGIKDLAIFLKDRKCKRMQDVTFKDIQAYKLHLMDRGLQPTTMKMYLVSVHTFFNYLEQNQKIFMNPTAKLVIPNPPRRMLPVPSEEDMQKLLARPDVSTSCGVRDRALFEVAYSTAARRSELGALKVSDIDFRNETIRVFGKGSKERVLPLGKSAILWLKEYLDDARPKILRKGEDMGMLWLRRSGKPLNPERISGIVEGHTKGAKLSVPVTIHSFRRACATHMLAHGAHPIQIQTLLGHACQTTMRNYIKITIAEIKRTHAMSKVGK